MQNTEEETKFTNYASQVGNRKDFLTLKTRYWIWPFETKDISISEPRQLDINIGIKKFFINSFKNSNKISALKESF